MNKKNFWILAILLILIISGFIFLKNFQNTEKSIETANILEIQETPNGNEYVILSYGSGFYFQKLDSDKNNFFTESWSLISQIPLPNDLWKEFSSNQELISYITENNPRITEEWISLNDEKYFIDNYKWWNLLDSQKNRIDKVFSSKDEILAHLETLQPKTCQIILKWNITGDKDNSLFDDPRGQPNYNNSIYKKYLKSTRTVSFKVLWECQKQIIECSTNEVAGFFRENCEGLKLLDSKWIFYNDHALMEVVDFGMEESIISKENINGNSLKLIETYSPFTDATTRHYELANPNEKISFRANLHNMQDFTKLPQKRIDEIKKNLIIIAKTLTISKDTGEKIASFDWNNLSLAEHFSEQELEKYHNSESDNKPYSHINRENWTIVAIDKQNKRQILQIQQPISWLDKSIELKEWSFSDPILGTSPIKTWYAVQYYKDWRLYWQVGWFGLSSHKTRNNENDEIEKYDEKFYIAYYSTDINTWNTKLEKIEENK